MAPINSCEKWFDIFNTPILKVSEPPESSSFALKGNMEINFTSIPF